MHANPPWHCPYSTCCAHCFIFAKVESFIRMLVILMSVSVLPTLVFPLDIWSVIAQFLLNTPQQGQGWVFIHFRRWSIILLHQNHLRLSGITPSLPVLYLPAYLPNSPPLALSSRLGELVGVGFSLSCLILFSLFQDFHTFHFFHFLP